MLASPPRLARKEIEPPTVEGVMRLLDVAWEEDPDLGTLSMGRDHQRRPPQ
ncbi:MAG: hypothetical protein ACRD0K_00340 [Egibacteraceae bacterium]